MRSKGERGGKRRRKSCALCRKKERKIRRELSPFVGERERIENQKRIVCPFAGEGSVRVTSNEKLCVAWQGRGESRFVRKVQNIIIYIKFLL